MNIRNNDQYKAGVNYVFRYDKMLKYVSHI